MRFAIFTINSNFFAKSAGILKFINRTVYKFINKEI